MDSWFPLCLSMFSSKEAAVSDVFLRNLKWVLCSTENWIKSGPFGPSLRCSPKQLPYNSRWHLTHFLEDILSCNLLNSDKLKLIKSYDSIHLGWNVDPYPGKSCPRSQSRLIRGKHLRSATSVTIGNGWMPWGLLGEFIWVILVHFW